MKMASQVDGAARRWQRRGEGHCLPTALAWPVGATMRALEVSRTQTPMSPEPPDLRWCEAGRTGAPWGEGRVDAYLTVLLRIIAPLTLAEYPH